MPDDGRTDDLKVKFERSEEFEDLYANNVRFESSVWDLKMLFGQLDIGKGSTEVVTYHTSVSIPWPAAKIMAYNLVVNVFMHQQEDGRITMRQGILPTRPDVNDPKLQGIDKDTLIYLAWVHDQFFGSDPFIPPGMVLQE